MEPSAMTSKFSVRELWRWILAAAGVAVAFVAPLYFWLFVLMFGKFPQDLAEPTAGFLMGLLVVLAGALLAPRRRLTIALILFASGTALAATVLKMHFPGVFTGGVVAVAFVGWWIHRRRTVRSTRWVGVGIFAAILVYIGVACARYSDRPASPDALSPELVQALGNKASMVSAFYRYDRGGFIDREWLWRIDAPPEVIALAVSRLKLERANAVPREFWMMPPHYWPRSMPADGEAFQSPTFSTDRRGPDGSHYFLVHDKAKGRAFVWVKDNF